LPAAKPFHRFKLAILPAAKPFHRFKLAILPAANHFHRFRLAMLPAGLKYEVIYGLGCQPVKFYARNYSFVHITIESYKKYQTKIK
jgi:hypothetical protein